MKCTCCGSEMVVARTDLPFKTGERSIIVVKEAPVLECPSCPEFLIADEHIARIEQLLADKSPSAELEVVRFAA